MEFLIPWRARAQARPGSSDDPIFALNAEARARKAAGEPILNATVGVMLDEDGELAVIDAVPRALRDVSAHVGAAYPPIAGSPDFRRAVAQELFGAREAASSAVVIATPGACGALRHCVATFLEPHQTLLTTSFYWGPYKSITDELERGLATFRFLDERGQLDTEDLERKVAAAMETQGRALILINSPCHNPTGYSLDRDDWRRFAAVIERASERGPVAVLLDLAYARYAGGSAEPDATIDALLPLAGKALLLFAWSASKTFTQYGLRVGALVAVHPDPEVRRVVEGALTAACRGTWSCCNAAGMAAVASVIVNPELRARADEDRAKLRAVLDRRVAAWNDLAGRAGLRYPRYSGGFFCTVLCDDAPAVAARLRGDGIYVVPLQGGIRVAICSVAERDIPRLVDGISKHVL